MILAWPIYMYIYIYIYIYWHKVLEDTSTNGTWLNFQKLSRGQSAPLEHGALVKLVIPEPGELALLVNHYSSDRLNRQVNPEQGACPEVL